MAERLAVYKTLTQRRAETVIGFAIGLALALVLRFATNLPVFVLPFAIVGGLFVAMLVNSRRLACAGAPQLSPLEVNRRTWRELAARPAVLTVAEWMVGVVVMLVGAMFVMFAADIFDREMLIVFAIAAAAGAVTGIRRVLVARAMVKAESEPVPATGGTLGGFLPRYYLGIALGLAVGLVVAFQLPQPWRIAALLVGMLTGVFTVPLRKTVAFAATQQKLVATRGFLKTAGSGVFLWGVPMTGYFLAMAPLLKPAVLDAPPLKLLQAAGMIVAIGLASGVAFGSLLWLIVKAIYWSGRGGKDSAPH